jgi:hypothetical protein
VPAFGEWNYYYYSGELSTPAPAAAEWYAPAASEGEACSDLWFKYSPPHKKAPPSRRKARRRPETTTDKSYSGGKRRVQAATTPARASDASAPKAPRRPAKAGDTARVVRSVDADLYQVPPPDFEPDEPRPTVCASKLKAHMHPSFFVDNDASQFSVPPVLNSILTVHYLFN